MSAPTAEKASLETSKIETMKAQVPAAPGTKEFVFPLMDGSAALRVPFPMGAENYTILLSAINAFEAALIGRKPPDESTPLAQAEQMVREAAREMSRVYDCLSCRVCPEHHESFCEAMLGARARDGGGR